jgi:vancomycin resistance protein YoaR
MPRVRLGRPSWPVIAGLGVAMLLVVLVLGDILVSWGGVHPGVSVDGVDVGGMGVSEARGNLERELGPRMKLPVTVAFESRRWTVTPSRVGATFAAQQAAEQAYAVGRTGNVLERVRDRVGAWFGRRTLVATASAQPDRLTSLLADLKKAVDVPPRDAYVAIKGTEVTRTPAKAGVTVREQVFRDDLLTAFVSQQRTVRLTVGYAPVSVTDEDADRAYEDAKRMVAGDLQLTYAGKSWDIPAEEVGSWIRFRAVPWSTDMTAAVSAAASAALDPSAEQTVTAGSRKLLVAYVDSREVSSTLTPLVKGVGKPSRDARFKVDGKKETVVPSQVGIGIDVHSLAGKLDRVLRTDTERTVAMTLAQTQPRLSTTQAQGMGIKELISTYSTEYDSGNAPRVNNIHTLARALDGKLVAPGGTFSFNGAVGERTAEKGYQEANAIVNGQLVPQLGGGICQTATTFFNAVFFSGFPVVERTNHSIYISHYPKGRDCTVSWDGPDFRWRNDSKHWVLVHTSYDSGSITFSLYGTDPGYKVAYTTGPFTNIEPYGVVKENDPDLALGQQEVKQSGVDGRKVVVVRTVTLNGKVLHKDTFASVYQPQDETIRVGTKASQTATTTPVPKKP